MENCRNATNLIGRKNRVLVVTSDYHLSRAVMTARRVGFDADGWRRNCRTEMQSGG